VQTPGGISIFYEMNQGQGWQRNIVMNGSPHLPASIRQWFGDSRGHWEGNTLVIDVTNFSPKTDFQRSRESLHLVERWAKDPRARGHDRRSDRIDAAMDRPAAVHQAERRGEQNLLRAALHRRKLQHAKGGRVADIDHAKGIPGVSRRLRDRGEVCRIGELVDIDHISPVSYLSLRPSSTRGRKCGCPKLPRSEQWAAIKR
jgi:hypothetical protein